LLLRSVLVWKILCTVEGAGAISALATVDFNSSSDFFCTAALAVHMFAHWA